MSQDAGVAYDTARRYLSVLEDTLVLWRIPAWSGSDRASLVVHPKILLFDLGVRNALLRRPLTQPLPDERGLLLEHFVGLELLRRAGTTWPEARLFHFRTRSGLEVDYVLEVGRELWGVEVIASDSGSRRDFRGLAGLGARTKPLKHRLVVFLGDRAQHVEGHEVLPLSEFMAGLPT